MTETDPTHPALDAEKTPVKQFRLIFQYPLVLDSRNEPDAAQGSANAEWIKAKIEETRQKLDRDKRWTERRDTLDYPDGIEPTGTDGGSYGQFAYFHDFAQKFLFPTGKDRPFTLFTRQDITDIKVTMPEGDATVTHDFAVDRLSLHLFKLGIAIFTLELNWTGSDSNCDLNLAQVQDLIDYTRRTYTPFWKKEVAQRVPKQVQLWAGDTLLCDPAPFSQQIAETQLANSAKVTPTRPDGAADIQIFDHWSEIISPLGLLCSGACWRDPSDERMPVNSFVVLATKEGAEQATMQTVSDSDWIRLADAEERGSGYPYNRNFIDPIAKGMYYDRFFPDAQSESATRHIFGGPHYSVVGAGWFFENVIFHHFRRHYALLSLVARFEMAALLAISSRLTDAVIRLENGGTEERYETDIQGISQQFLAFVQRYRFTGISSQVQAAEMFDRWRASLGLDLMYQDLRQEVDTAFQQVSAQQQKRASDASVDLTKLASVGVVLGLIVGVVDISALFTQTWPVIGMQISTVAVAVAASTLALGIKAKGVRCGLQKLGWVGVIGFAASLLIHSAG